MGRILISQPASGYAGHFRIGDIILDIPPEQIQCHKVINDNEVQPLRFPFALQVKTGQSRWDVTWSWKAIIDPSQTNPYNQWYIIQRLLAIFKAAPFVEVENEHIRQIVNPGALTPGSNESDTMAFALRQMRIDTVPDYMDTLQVTMTMSFFNYRPYSAHFQYADSNGNPVASALLSPPFSSYLDKWIQTNLQVDPTQYLNGETQSSDFHWESQEPGSMTLTVREYTAAQLPMTLLEPGGDEAPSAANQAGSAQGTGSGNFVDNATISPVDKSNPDIQWWVQSVVASESGGDYNSVNKKTKTNSGAPSVAVGICQWVRGSALDAMAASDKYLGTAYMSTAKNGGYIVSSTKSSSRYTWSTKSFPNPQSTDPSAATYISWMQNPPASTGGEQQLQNNMATAWALLQLQANKGSVLKSWEAHRFGQGIVNNGQGNSQKDQHWFNTAAGVWRSAQHTGHSQDFLPPANNTPAPQPTPPIPTATATSGTNTSSTSGSTTNDPGEFPITPYIQWLLTQGWQYDYATESTAFLYKEHWIRMANQDAKYQAACSDIPGHIDVNYFIQPIQISVILVNNIAQMPIASYQYPTYQHLGPISTLVSVGMLSTAQLEPATDTYKEPEHTGLNFISGMTNMMENQFQRLRSEWRRINSIHRMQSYVVKNQILNMLGIRGLLVKEMTTETVPDSPNLVNAQCNFVQYENVYIAEVPSPFKVAAVPGQISAAWLQLLTDPNSPLTTDPMISKNAQLNALVNLAKLMQAPNSHSTEAQQVLADWLTKTTIGHMPPDLAYSVATPVLFTPDQQALMIKLLDEQAYMLTPGNTAVGVAHDHSFTQLYSDRSATIKTHSQLNYADYMMIRYETIGTPDYPTFQAMTPTIDAAVAKAVTASQGTFKDPIDQLWVYYAGWAQANNTNLIRNQMAMALTVPQLKPYLLDTDGQYKPGSLQINKDHGCYSDLGIKDLKIGGVDYTPAYYFYDDNENYTDRMQAQATTVADNAIASAAALAKATPYTDKTNLLVSTSTESFTSGAAAILNLVHPSAYSMTKAYPTFKLFLMEDHSDKPFFSYDNFYSYATVLDMEIIRYRNKPDTAVIQISNLMHLLDQHLYDNTVQGRFEKSLRARFENQRNSQYAGTGGAAGLAAVSIPTAPGGEIQMVSIDNRFNEIKNYSSGNSEIFPLKYFALQTGSKIQIRMGFSNNPDLLEPVFTGQVTQLEGDEILTITAQSFMLELIQPTSDQLGPGGSGFSVDKWINSIGDTVAKIDRDTSLIGGNLLNVPNDIKTGFFKRTAYGGWGKVGGATIPYLLSPGGTAKDVMAAMLKTSTAVHFGGWQYGAPTDRFLKGFKWQTAVASSLLFFSNSPLTKGATGLESGYDRSYENILTSHVFGVDGSAIADINGNIRPWWFEQPGGYGAPEYYVKDDPTLTPWTLIQDIARRMPEFILTVKQYGFPFTADATLVYGNPHDFYNSRLPQPLEQEIDQQLTEGTEDSTKQLFYKWWFLNSNGTKSGGRSASGRAQMENFCNTVGAPWLDGVVVAYDKSIGLTQTRAENKQLNSNPGNFIPLTTELLGHIDAGGAGAFNAIVNMYVDYMGAGKGANAWYSTLGFLTNVVGSEQFYGVSADDAQSKLQQIADNFKIFFTQNYSGSNPLALPSRLKPVRKYHLVNGDSIIHNGITLNGDFYNTIHLDKQELVASVGIPSNYTRVLDANNLVVDIDNCKGWPESQNTYMQSFLRDEIAKMYRGELVLLGNPEIEPYDVILLIDPSTGISGPIEVDSVIHSFNQENGYITIVKPRAMVLINDKLSAPLYMAQFQMLCELQGAIEERAQSVGLSKTDNIGGETALGVVETLGLAVTGPIWGIAGVAGLGMIMFWAGKEVQRMNPLGLVPLTRLQRPWVAGIEGWQNANFIQALGLKWGYFKTEEWEPLVESYRTARGMQLI